MEGGAFHAGHEFHDAERADVHDEAVDDLVAEVAVGHLAAAEAQAGLYLVAFAKEADGLVLFRLVVMLVDGDRELDFLDDDDLLLLTGSAVALVLLVEVLAVVLNAAHRRDGIWGNLYEVKGALTCNFESIERGHDAELFAIFIDYANFARADFFVGTDERLDGTLVGKRWNNWPPQCSLVVDENRPPASLQKLVYNALISGKPSENAFVC